MKDDVEKYIARRKRTDGAFAGDFSSGYEAFKIGAMLRQAREDAGVTQETLARITKTKKSAIARLENHAQDVRLGDWFDYPKGIVSSSPGLAPCAYPGEMVGGFLNPNRGCGQAGGARGRSQPQSVEETANHFPKVGAGCQPWAGGHNPFGIGKPVA